jgi:hypothetical protein
MNRGIGNLNRATNVEVLAVGSHSAAVLKLASIIDLSNLRPLIQRISSFVNHSYC